ncbi:hypothetical protein HDU76_011856, partial [Blyttiomyces sp. JEL0837]
MEDADTDINFDDFVDPNVKEKIMKSHERELERSVSAHAGLESWDDDFLGGNDDDHNGGGIDIPDTVCQLQKSLKMDGIYLKKFALHVEDLRRMYLDAIKIFEGLEAQQTPSKSDTLISLQNSYLPDLERVQVLIDLGEYSEDKPDNMVSDDRHLRILADILSLSTQSQGDDEKTTTAKAASSSSSSSTLVELKEIAATSGKLQFGGELVPLLIRGIVPIKARLGLFISELKEI